MVRPTLLRTFLALLLAVAGKIGGGDAEQGSEEEMTGRPNKPTKPRMFNEEGMPVRPMPKGRDTLAEFGRDKEFMPPYVAGRDDERKERKR